MCCVYKIYIKSDYDFRNRFIIVFFINLFKTKKYHLYNMENTEININHFYKFIFIFWLSNFLLL